MATFDTQGPYLNDLASGSAGEPGQRDANTTVLSMLVEVGSVTPGQAVGYGGSDRSVRLGGSGFAGVVQLNKSALFPSIPAGQYVSVLRSGTIKVAVSTSVTVDDTVTFDPATGAIGAGLSEAIPNAAFTRAASAGSIVMLFLDRDASKPADGGSAGPTVPSWTAQPFFTASSPTVGDTIIIDPGDLSGTQPITIEVEYFRLAGVDKSGELSGLSWDSTGETAGTVTARLRATNAGGPVLSAEITVDLAAAQTGGNSYTASVADFGTDEIVFDTGAAFGRSQATIPITVPTTNAPNGTDLEARSVLASDGTTVVEDWKVIGQAAGGSCNGSFAATQAAGGDDWILLEVRVVGSDQAPARMTTKCDIGHVVAVMGQSELDRLFITTGGSYSGTFTSTEQFPVIVGDATYTPDTPGNPVTGFTVTKDFIASGSGIAVKMQHYADAWLKNGVTRKVKTIDLTQSAHGRFQLSDDTEPNRRWTDFVACLNAAGWADGVRPGVIIDMWTNADVVFATDFMTAYKPFYTGIKADGSDYTLGDGITVETFPGTPGVDDVTIQHDHILFDLGGNGQGLFDPAVTKIILCHHRYDPYATDMDNALIDGSKDVVTDMWAQELIREAYDGLLADPDLSQIMERGTEPLNYENGSVTGGGASWGDQIHPGQGPDGLQLFARHLAHAAMRACGVVPATVPEFDTVSFDPAGAHADFSWSGGNITTTRKLRGLADPSPAPGPHWTDVFGFEFNDIPVERAELQPNGSVRVYVPAAEAPADWSRDRFFFGRGGGSGVLLPIADPLEGAWLNYPVVDADSLGVAGLYDDTAQSTGGIAVRPLRALPSDLAAPDAFRAAAVNTQDAWFRDPNGISVAAGGDATQLHAELEMAFRSTQHLVRLLGIADDVDLFVNRSLETRTMVWAAGGSATASSFAPVPGVRYTVKLAADMIADTLRVYANDTLVIDDALGGVQNRFINGAQINVLGNVDAADGTIITPDAEFISFRCWVNENTVDDSTPATAPHKEILASSGVAALDADPWRQAGGTIVPFDQGASAPETPPIPADTVYIDSNTAFETYLAEGKADPQSKDGDEVVFAPDLEITVSGTGWQGGFNATPQKRIWRSLDPTRPASFKNGMSIRSTRHSDDADLGNMDILDIEVDMTAAATLLPPEQDNDQTDAIAISIAQSANGNRVRDVKFAGLGFEGPFPNYLLVNQDASKQVIGISGFCWEGLTVEGCSWRRMSTGLILGGRNIKVGRNRYKGNAEDFLRLSVARFKVGGVDVYDWTEDVVVPDNVFGAANSKNRLHPDLVQFSKTYAGGAAPDGLGIRRMTFRGIVTYEGEALDCPIYPTARDGGFAAGGMFGANSGRVVSALPASPTKGIVYRLTDTAGGIYTLPDPALYAIGDRFAIQLEATAETYNTWTIQPPPGVTLSVNQGPASVPGFDLVKPNMTVELLVISATEWQLIPKLPNNNMYQSNMVGAQGSFVDIAFINCVHITQGSITIRIEGNWQNVLVDGCLLARTLPGDRTGNGIANEFADGYFPQGNNPGVVCKNGHNVVVRNCIAASINSTNGTGTNITVENNHILDYSDEAGIRALYPAITTSGDGIAQFPESESEVVTLFRPAAGSSVDSNAQGPLRADAANDRHPFAWVATHTAGPGQTNSGIDYSHGDYPVAA